MRIGNAFYKGPEDLPEAVPLFPLPGVLLLPRAQLPLNIFEPRYLAMVEAALGGNRLIGMVQPRFGEAGEGSDQNGLYAIGCAGRITGFSEAGDGRYLITLTGIARFRIEEEVNSVHPFRLGRISALPFAADFTARAGEAAVDRPGLLKTFRAYLEANDLEVDWENVESASTESLVNALSMMSPFGAAEKQALLEAPDLKTRADTLVAITEMTLARGAHGGGPVPLQ